jgi:hypothetical protein
MEADRVCAFLFIKVKIKIIIFIYGGTNYA